MSCSYDHLNVVLVIIIIIGPFLSVRLVRHFAYFAVDACQPPVVFVRRCVGCTGRLSHDYLALVSVCIDRALSNAYISRHLLGK